LDAAIAQAVITRFPDYTPTPLVELPELARQLGVARLLVKDERGRFNLGSFKALGGAYAVWRLASGTAETKPTFAAATAGNHGRSVAAGASMMGARSVIFVYDGVPEAQIDAIGRHGAEIVRVRGFYEDALAACKERSAADGWVVVSDTSWPGYDEIPRLVMQGYLVLMAEMSAQAPNPPGHIFVQAGVGGLAGAVAAYVSHDFTNRPKVVVVESEAAPCLLESVRAGCPIAIEPLSRTNMGRLECFVPSALALEILAAEADALVTVSDCEAAKAAALLALAEHPTTPSAAAGLAGLARVLRHEQATAALHLNSKSVVAVILTEGAGG
jgi:diaminopropionate ammonia-lyase